jgi:hypothetical protein
MGQHKECVSKLNGVRIEAVRREHKINLQTQGEISRWLSLLKRKTVWREAQSRVIEHSIKLFQEGIEIGKTFEGETRVKVLENPRITEHSDVGRL